MHSPFLGELLGTMTLIVFGDGVIAGVLLTIVSGDHPGFAAIPSSAHSSARFWAA